MNEALHTEYMRAALALAQAVSTVDRIANDPTYPADRSVRAERLRTAEHPLILARFRAAESAFLKAGGAA